MTVTEFLQFVDNLVFSQTDKHLDDIQQKIIEGLFQGKSYKQIAENYGYDEGYIGDLSRKLFKIVSEQLKQDINKHNFCWTVERFAHKSKFNSNSLQQGLINSYINLCSNNPKDANQDIQKTPDKKEIYHDLKFAPKIINFYNRESELKTLYNWICKGERPFTPTLICILGLAGIGKTTLVKRFVDLNLDNFEVIIWKSLKYPKSLTLLINDFLTVCKLEPKETLDDKLTQLFDILTDKKCLIILDDVQKIFISGDFAGKYKPEYQDYQNFFTMITETAHQSNVILISQESCPEMHCLDEDLYPIKCLELSGLYDVEILRNKGLTDSSTSLTNHEDSWLQLINLYQGDIFYLKSIIMLINTNYDGQVAEFLAENTLHITNQMQSHFQKIFNHLSPIEQQIVLKLSQVETPILREELRQSLNFNSVDFNNGLESLQQRYLVMKIKTDKIMFKLDSVLREYVINCC